MTNTPVNLIARTFAALIASFASIASNAFEGLDVPLVAIGEADVSSLGTYSLSVNGQKFVFDDHTVTAIENSTKSGNGPSGARLIRDGDYVAVSGELMDPGVTLATTIIILDEAYVDGASPTYVRAIIDGVDSSGYAYSRDSAVDYTASLYETQSIQPGDVVEFEGVSVEGVMLATSTLSGQRSSGLRGQRSSGLRGQRSLPARTAGQAPRIRT